MGMAMASLHSPHRLNARDRLEREGKALNALVALAQPQAPREGPLSGLTFVAKDMFSWPDYEYSRGLNATVPFDGKPAVFLNQLIAEGAELLGFAEMTPLAYEPSGANPFRGRPINPLNADYISGGSSSGSAVLVAAGLVDFAVGSDTAGSLRIPAQCCGVTAWKPSFGLLCRGGSWPLAPSLDTLGLLARSVEMLLRVGNAIIPPGNGQPLRMAIADDLVWQNDDRARVMAAAQDFKISTINLQSTIELCDDVVLTLLQQEAYESNRALIGSGELDSVLERRLSHGAAVTPAAYETALAGHAVLRAEVAEKLFDSADVIALPVMPCATPRVAMCEPGQPEFAARHLYDLSRYTRFVNALGLPAVALPLAGNHSAMPTAVQLIARHGTDLTILRAAQQIETRLKGSAA
jgi:Asp-tRNA(Asn)/Glu-tRNA(Gln) amidotransferase A subunit family amidase